MSVAGDSVEVKVGKIRGCVARIVCVVTSGNKFGSSLAKYVIGALASFFNSTSSARARSAINSSQEISRQEQ